MATVKAKYLGDLRLECTHLQSGTKIITDAPTDNNGKGEAFSDRFVFHVTGCLCHDNHGNLC